MPLEPIVEALLRLVLSRQGQEVVLKGGYVPVPESVAKRARTELGMQVGLSGRQALAVIRHADFFASMIIFQLIQASE